MRTLQHSAVASSKEEEKKKKERGKDDFSSKHVLKTAESYKTRLCSRRTRHWTKKKEKNKFFFHLFSQIAIVLAKFISSLFFLHGKSYPRTNIFRLAPSLNLKSRRFEKVDDIPFRRSTPQNEIGCPSEVRAVPFSEVLEKKKAERGGDIVQ